MTPNDARKEAVETVVALFTNVNIVAKTQYGFTIQHNGHRIRFSAQSEEQKHPRARKS